MRIRRGVMELGHQEAGSKMIAPGRWVMGMIVQNGDVTLSVQGVGGGGGGGARPIAVRWRRATRSTRECGSKSARLGSCASKKSEFTPRPAAAAF
jgi:hypothetical protein